jgi:hypothetical protein
MPLNNTGLYDAVIAGIALSNGAWPSDTNASDYAPEASAAVAIATEVDAGIPTIAGGATVSQRLVMQTVTKGCMTGRVAISMQPTDYSAVAAGIIAVYTEFVTKLQDTNIEETFVNLSNVIFVDGTTIVPSGSETGNIEAPFGLISDGVTAVPTGGTIYITPHDYSAQGAFIAIKNLTAKALGIATFAQITVQAGVTAITLENLTCTGTLTVPTGCTLTLNNCIIGNQIVGNDCVIVANGSSVTGNVSCSVIVADACSFSDTFSVSGGVSVITNTTWLHPHLIFTSSAGVLSLDGETYNNWLSNTGVIANGNISLRNSLLSASVPVTVPILANGEVEYVNVNVSTTVLKGITTGTPIAANPTEDLAPGGTGGAAFCPAARVSATNTVRLTVVGPVTPAKNTNFIITQLAAK